MSIIASFIVPHPPLIVPDIGKGSEKQIEKTINSYEEIAREIANIEPETIIISSPHTAVFKDYFYISTSDKMTGSFSSFGAENISFEEDIDKELVTEIENIANNENFPAGGIKDKVNLDHGTMVPLYFIRKQYPKSNIIVVGLSGLYLEMHFHLGKIIAQAIDNLDRKVVFIASGDLSHKLQKYGPYGYSEYGETYEKKILQTLSNGNLSELLNYQEDFLIKAAECGHSSFTIMAGIWKNKNINTKFFSHEDITGVGYGIWSFYPKIDEYVSLAKLSIETYIRNHEILKVPEHLSKDLLKEKRGVFVSIHKQGQLRGCIGTILPTQECVAKEIIDNAISAATRDPRFPEITEEELKDLEINVDVLTPPEPIQSQDELDPKKYGVIVSKGFKKGLLLPDLEGINTVEEQILIAKNKCGIKKEEEVSLERFEVIRHK